MNKHLVLLSGGGFSTEKDSYIDQFALNLCSKTGKKNIVFIPTASYDSESYIRKCEKAFSKHHFNYLTKENLLNDKITKQADLIYIGGGDTTYMLKTWREIGFDKHLVDLYNQGTIIVGISAGAVCWFTTVFENHNISKGLNILSGSFCPHYDDLNDYRESYDTWALNNPEIKHYKLNNNEALHVINGKIVAKIIS